MGTLKRTLALSVAAVAGSAMAQQLPPDVPANHWAAPSVSRLFELGVLQGYPDGLYRGARPTSRYELAHALGNLLTEFTVVTGDLQRQLDALRAMPPASQNHQELEARIQSLGIQSQQLMSQGNEIDSLKSTFADLGRQIGAIRESVQSMKTGLPR